jgi:hypothetical protein
VAGRSSWPVEDASGDLVEVRPREQSRAVVKRRAVCVNNDGWLGRC